MPSLKDIATIAIIDIETSSLEEDTEILEIAIWSISEKVWSNSVARTDFNSKYAHRISEVISTLFKPRKNIHGKASKVNKLRKEDLIDKPFMNKESLKPIAEFIENLTKPCLFIAHNGFAFDYKHLARYMKKYNITFGGKECYFGDSLVEFRKAKDEKNSIERLSFRLEHLYKTYVEKDFCQKHTALNDCEKLSILLQNRWDVMVQIARNAKDFKWVCEITETKTPSQSEEKGGKSLVSSTDNTEYQLLIEYVKHCRERYEEKTDEPKIKKKKINDANTKTPIRRIRKNKYRPLKIIL